MKRKPGPARLVLTPEIEAEIRRGRAERRSGAWLAARVGVSYGVMYRWIRELELPMLWKPRERNR